MRKDTTPKHLRSLDKSINKKKSPSTTAEFIKYNAKLFKKNFATGLPLIRP